jgi:hypothetical protein
MTSENSHAYIRTETLLLLMQDRQLSDGPLMRVDLTVRHSTTNLRHKRLAMDRLTHARCHPEDIPPSLNVQQKVT